MCYSFALFECNLVSMYHLLYLHWHCFVSMLLVLKIRHDMICTPSIKKNVACGCWKHRLALHELRSVCTATVNLSCKFNFMPFVWLPTRLKVFLWAKIVLQGKILLSKYDVLSSINLRNYCQNVWLCLSVNFYAWNRSERHLRMRSRSQSGLTSATCLLCRRWLVALYIQWPGPLGQPWTTSIKVRVLDLLGWDWTGLWIMFYWYPFICWDN